MNAPAISANQSPLEAALHEVQATLTHLLVAADEQYAAVAANDRERLESVTRQQERLSARLARAEARRMQLVGTSEWTANLPADAASRVVLLKTAIAAAVLDLKERQAQTPGLLKQQIDLASQTINFLRRLVTQPNPTYTGRGMSNVGHSVLVDGRA